MGNCCNSYIRYLILRGTRFFYNDGSDSINPEDEDGVEQDAIFTNHNSDSQQPESGIDSMTGGAPIVLPKENGSNSIISINQEIDDGLTDTETLTPN